MKPFSDSSVIEDLLRAKASDAEALQAELTEMGNAGAWWARQGFGAPPDGLCDAEVRNESLGFFRWAADRERKCAVCPPSGGACADPSELERGQRLGWDPVRRLPVRQPCDRWQRFVSRNWLVRSGVAARGLDFALENWTFPHAAAVADVKAFVRGALGLSPPTWLVVSGDHGKGKTHLGVGLLREVRTRNSSVTTWYRDVREQIRPLKDFYSNPNKFPDPFERVRHLRVCTLDNVDLSRAPGWLRDAIEDSLLVRWSQELPTVITTHESVARLAQALPNLTGFADVPELVLP